ncbi:MAG: VanZ family protein [Patescibacteria group bacterium]|nr:MAG: VanZ family protein [Patescibacteria group bacterium]
MVQQAYLKLKKQLSLWLPVLFWMGLIYYLSAQSGLKIGEGAVDFWTRKPAHVGEYAVLFLLLFRALRGGFRLSVRQLYLSAGVFTLLYAASDEIHQIFVPLREGRVADLGFDLLGILVGALAVRYFFNRRES